MKTQLIGLFAVLLIASCISEMKFASADCGAYSNMIPANKFVGNNTSITLGAENCFMVKSNAANIIKGERMNQKAEKAMQAYIEKEQLENHMLHQKYLPNQTLNESMNSQLEKTVMAKTMSYQAFVDNSNYYYDQLQKKQEILSMMKIIKQQRFNISDVNYTQ